MKYIFATLFLSALSIVTIAQNPTRWSFSAKKINAKTYEIYMTAELEDGWHTYSQFTPDGGPAPTEISFTKNPLVTLAGKAKEVGKLEEHFEPLFGVKVKQFSDKIVYVQTITLKAPVKTTVSGKVSFMVCNDRECLPPVSKSFSINLN